MVERCLKGHVSVKAVLERLKKQSIMGGETVNESSASEQERRVTLETGSMTIEEVEAMLNTLPIDITC